MKRLIPILILVLLTGCSQKNNWELYSPDKALGLHVSLNKDAPGTPLLLHMEKGGRVLVDSIELGLDIQEFTDGGMFRVVDMDVDAHNEQWTRVWGRSKEVRNHYHELGLLLENKEAQQIKVEFRAYNEGIAFRYLVPEQPGLEDIRVNRELTTLQFDRDPEVWATKYDGSYSHQENEFIQMKLSELEPAHLPFLVKATDQDWLALSEAMLVNWAGFHLEPDPLKNGGIRIVLEPRADDPSMAVIAEAGAASPWRVLMVEDHPGRFLENNMIQNLNDPCQIEDTEWIQAGKSAWDWWWSNSYAPDAGFELGSNTATMKYFIDFAAEMGWEYQLVDWQWYGEPFAPTEEFENFPNPDVDITKSTDKIDIPALVEYAHSKNVKLLLWLEWNHADRQMEEAFPLYEEWGISGVKVDFMAREDQEMVQFYERLVKLAAKHHLVVDFHGAYKPTGLSRTWPNLMTREGVMGNEYSKWSDRITPEHTVTLAYTRNILGEMDFTPGAWINVTPEEFRNESAGQPPVVMSTRCNQLAEVVVFESALTVLCDSPYNYRKSPGGLDFLSMVPTSWDETRFLQGEIGNYIALARRSGEDWFIGVMTDLDPREIELGLDFLGEGSYTATIWKDGAEAASKPMQLEKEELEVDPSASLSLSLASGGGCVIHLTKE